MWRLWNFLFSGKKSNPVRRMTMRPVGSWTDFHAQLKVGFLTWGRPIEGRPDYPELSTKAGPNILCNSPVTLLRINFLPRTKLRLVGPSSHKDVIRTRHLPVGPLGPGHKLARPSISSKDMTSVSCPSTLLEAMWAWTNFSKPN